MNIDLLYYGLIASVLSLIGGFIVLWRANFVRKITTWLLAFAAGAFLGVGFLDLLPEAIEMVEEPHFVFIAVLVGFFIFFSIERLLMRYFPAHEEGSHGHGEHTESLPLLVVIGDTLHNFLDGIVIAIAFVAEPTLGLATALAVAAHEIPQEIGDFAILLDQGWSKTKIMVVNVISSLTTLLGIAAGYFAATFFEGWLAYLLGGTAGIFIYIAASDLIPEVHHRSGHKNAYRILFVFLLSLVLIGYLIFSTHGE
jgi:zinc and cadmium transporter